MDSNDHTFSSLAALVARLLRPGAVGLTEVRLAAAMAEAYPRR